MSIFVKLLVLIILVYIMIYSIVDRICKSHEQTIMAKTYADVVDNGIKNGVDMPTMLNKLNEPKN